MLKRTRINSDIIRQRLFLLRRAKKTGVREACQFFGKNRSYYYYWFKKYENGDWKSLSNSSRKPKRMPRLTEDKKVKSVIRMRRRTNYGKERIHDCLKDKGIIVPVSTIGKILDREGLLVKRRTFKTQKKHTRVYNLIYPGQRLQMDIKYVPSEKSPIGRKYYQYTVTDECTRMRYLAWYDSIWTANVVSVLKEAKTFFGFKLDCVQTDNGVEFTFDYTARLTAKHKEPKEHPLDIYCEEQQMRHKLIPPGEKELQGKVERSHRTDDEEFYRRINGRINLMELRKRGAIWMKFYNFKRRHSGIGKKTPVDFKNDRLKLYPERIAA